jgi:hypothetical protein
MVAISSPAILIEPSPEPPVYRIPNDNLPTFRSKFEKLARTAIKLGIAPPTFDIIKETTTESRATAPDGSTVFIITLYHHIIIHNPAFALPDYAFVATIEHTEEGNIIHSIRGTTIPAQYRNTDPFCDHCKLSRRRNETFLVRHIPTNSYSTRTQEARDYSVYKQVGRNCIHDFLGHNAAQLASRAELAIELSELGEACEAWDGETRGERFEMLDAYLSHVSAVINESGWVSRAAENPELGIRSTCSVAFRRMVDRAVLSTDDKEVATAAIEWCGSLSDDAVEGNDYLHNIRVIARRGVFSSRQSGFAASIVSAFQRAQSELRAKERAAGSVFVGVVGERSVFALTVEKVLEFSGAYGTTFLHILSDDAGNRFVWRSSGTCLKTGQRCFLKGTVKEHVEYKGTKQTVLSRCVELDCLPESKAKGSRGKKTKTEAASI